MNEDILNICTDGSFFPGDQQAGCAYYITKTGESRSCRLPYYTDIFNAELYGIDLAIEKALRDNIPTKNWVDSVSALRAISSGKPRSFHAKRIIKKLRSAQSHNISFEWTPGRSQITGNDKADEYARKAAKRQLVEAKEVALAPWLLKSRTKLLAEVEWERFLRSEGKPTGLLDSITYIGRMECYSQRMAPGKVRRRIRKVFSNQIPAKSNRSCIFCSEDDSVSHRIKFCHVTGDPEFFKDLYIYIYIYAKGHC